jgi:hypothetical protein
LILNNLQTLPIKIMNPPPKIHALRPVLLSSKAVFYCITKMCVFKGGGYALLVGQLLVHYNT